MLPRTYTLMAAIVMAMTALGGCARKDAISSSPPAPQLPRASPQPSAQDQQYPSTGVEIWDPPAVPYLLPPPIDRTSDELTPQEERKAIAVAREYLEHDLDEPVNGDFNARRVEGGYTVFVQFHFGYNEQGSPLMVPGGHCMLLISTDWKVVRVVRGA